MMKIVPVTKKAGEQQGLQLFKQLRPQCILHQLLQQRRWSDFGLLCWSWNQLLAGAALDAKSLDMTCHPRTWIRFGLRVLEHTDIDPDDLTLHHSDGTVLEEYQDKRTSLIWWQPIHYHECWNYGNDERDLCHIKDLDSLILNWGVFN